MRVLNSDETRQLLAAIPPRSPFAERDEAMLTLLLHTGLRVSELVGLDVKHVAHAGQPRAALFIPPSLGKGHRERLVPLNAIARQAIVTLLAFNQRRGFSVAPETPLLVTRKHQRLTVRAVQRLVKELREQADLDVPATPHTLRHSFATNVLRKSGNLRTLQQLLGHSRLSTVEIYTHVHRDDLVQAVNALVP